ncbi:MAG: VTT domain-containing protein [Coriobacteriales bacterium]|jgi:uncharacterized membrane protein YdjX (TVP38/TMEM64 family)|nr:VTT domain-containing protein [Coriobacteriales bacterium]
MTTDSSESANTDLSDSTSATPGLSTADKIKFIGLLVFILLTLVIGFYIVRFLLEIGDTDDVVASLTASIRDAGVFGVLLCLGLQFLQIVIAIIPGEIVQAAIGLVYGTVWGGLITLAGALVSSIFVFYLVKALGAPFVAGMLGKQDSKRAAVIQRFFTNSKRLNATVFILFLIPGMPKDIFTYLVPLSPMKATEFFVLSTLGRAPAIFATTFVVSAFARGDYLACAIVALIFGGLGLVGIVYNMKIMDFVHKIIDKLHPHHTDPQAVEQADDLEDSNESS